MLRVAWAGRQARPRHRRQLRAPQTPQGAGLAQSSPALHLPLRADRVLLAERGERLVAKLAKRRLKRGVFRSVVDLQTAINRFVEETNQRPKPFTWTADPDTIIAAVRRGHQALDSVH
jgi:hypothetical protein